MVMVDSMYSINVSASKIKNHNGVKKATKIMPLIRKHWATFMSLLWGWSNGSNPVFRMLFFIPIKISITIFEWMKFPSEWTKRFKATYYHYKNDYSLYLWIVTNILNVTIKQINLIINLLSWIQMYQYIMQ